MYGVSLYVEKALGADFKEKSTAFSTSYGTNMVAVQQFELTPSNIETLTRRISSSGFEIECGDAIDVIEVRTRIPNKFDDEMDFTSLDNFYNACWDKCKQLREELGSTSIDARLINKHVYIFVDIFKEPFLGYSIPDQRQILIDTMSEIEEYAYRIRKSVCK